MLVTVAAAALLWILGAWIVAIAVRRLMRRLRIDPRTALIWLGLAEEPGVPRSARPRLKELFLDERLPAPR